MQNCHNIQVMKEPNEEDLVVSKFWAAYQLLNYGKKKARAQNYRNIQVMKESNEEDLVVTKFRAAYQVSNYGKKKARA